MHPAPSNRPVDDDLVQRLREQGASMLEGLENDERNRGNCSTAEGAGCSAHAVRRLASALLMHEREIGQCLHQIQEPTVNQQLTDAQIKEGRRAVNDDPDDQPEPWAFREGVKFAERMHGITKEKQA